MPLARITRRFYFTGFERSLEPDGSAAVERDHIEAARRLAPKVGEVLPRRGLDARALAPADAFGAAAVLGARAHAHLDEHQRRAIAGDEIDLPQARAVVARDDREALALEEARGGLFRGASRR